MIGGASGAERREQPARSRRARGPHPRLAKAGRRDVGHHHLRTASPASGSRQFADERESNRRCGGLTILPAAMRMCISPSADRSRKDGPDLRAGFTRSRSRALTHRCCASRTDHTEIEGARARRGTGRARTRRRSRHRHRGRATPSAAGPQTSRPRERTKGVLSWRPGYASRQCRDRAVEVRSIVEPRIRRTAVVAHATVAAGTGCARCGVDGSTRAYVTPMAARCARGDVDDPTLASITVGDSVRLRALVESVRIQPSRVTLVSAPTACASSRTGREELGRSSPPV